MISAEVLTVTKDDQMRASPSVPRFQENKKEKKQIKIVTKNCIQKL
jgi:hypothetical protein